METSALVFTHDCRRVVVGIDHECAQGRVIEDAPFDEVRRARGQAPAVAGSEALALVPALVRHPYKEIDCVDATVYRGRAQTAAPTGERAVVAS